MVSKQKWQVYLNTDSKYSSCYAYVWADVCVQGGETWVNADGVIIDFENEILGLSKVN